MRGAIEVATCLGSSVLLEAIRPLELHQVSFGWKTLGRENGATSLMGVELFGFCSEPDDFVGEFEEAPAVKSAFRYGYFYFVINNLFYGYAAYVRAVVIYKEYLIACVY